MPDGCGMRAHRTAREALERSRARAGSLALVRSTVWIPSAIARRPAAVEPSREAAKQLRVVERLWSELSIDRPAPVVALGGGALTDTAGFAAATYLRGAVGGRADDARRAG